MYINTYIRPDNEKAATKILRKGRGAWGEFVNKALAAYPQERKDEADKEAS